MELRGRLVVLRDKRSADADDDFRWRSDEELSRLDAAPPLRLTRRQFRAAFEEELDYPHTRTRRFSIDDLAGKHIGNCMYYDIDYTHAEAELGIMIGNRDCWGRGYGTDAVLTLVSHIFRDTSLQRVYLATLEWNERAQRSFAKCGFVPCGSMTRGSQHFVLMQTFRDDFLRRAAATAAQAGDASAAAPRTQEG